MKSYTDIEQSKKLAEILPIESADMFFSGCAYPKELHFPTFSKTSIKDNIPCWSLAALLKLMPKIESNEPWLRKLYYISEPTERYICQYSLTDMTSEYDNPVDACVEMIIDLHELKML